MLQAVVYLCNAYAVELMHRGQLEASAILLQKAESLTKKSVLKKCRVTDYIRVGLRTATFNTASALFRKQGKAQASFRSLQRALKAERKKGGLEVIEAATLINMGVILTEKGNLVDSVLMNTAALEILQKHEPEALRAWYEEADLDSRISSGQIEANSAAGRSGRSARLNALWAMMSIGNYNLAAAKEAKGKLAEACDLFQKSYDVALKYNGPASEIASCVQSTLTDIKCGFQTTPKSNAKKPASRDDVELKHKSSLISVETSPLGSGYVHWGHAPTVLRKQLGKDQSKRAGGRRKPGKRPPPQALLPSLLWFQGAARVDGLGLPAPLVNGNLSSQVSNVGSGQQTTSDRRTPIHDSSVTASTVIRRNSISEGSAAQIRDGEISKSKRDTTSVFETATEELQEANGAQQAPAHERPIPPLILRSIQPAHFENKESELAPDTARARKQSPSDRNRAHATGRRSSVSDLLADNDKSEAVAKYLFLCAQKAQRKSGSMTSRQDKRDSVSTVVRSEANHSRPPRIVTTGKAPRAQAGQISSKDSPVAEPGEALSWLMQAANKPTGCSPRFTSLERPLLSQF